MAHTGGQSSVEVKVWLRAWYLPEPLRATLVVQSEFTTMAVGPRGPQKINMDNLSHGGEGFLP